MASKIKVAVASTSAIKRDAVMKALDMIPPENIDLITVNVESGVSSQPMGMLETMSGAVNRAAAAQQLHPDRLVVAIENGLIELIDGVWIDQAVLVAVQNDKNVVTVSAGVPVPNHLVCEAIDTNKTIGEVVSPARPKDPHAVLTNHRTHRECILTEAVKILLSTFV